MQKLRITVILTILFFASVTGVLVVLSLLPYLSAIGIVSAVVLALLLLCGISLAITYTTTTIQKMKHSANMIVAGDVVSYYRNGEFVHLSAIHEDAKLPYPLQLKEATVKELPKTDEDYVIERVNQGKSLREIAEETGLTYYKVQKISRQYMLRKFDKQPNQA